MSTQKHTEQDAIDALRSVAEEIDKSPTQSDYRKNKTDEDPSLSWITRNLSNWNNAKELAGLDVTAWSHEHTEEDGIESLQYVAEEIGKSPTQTEYMRNRKDHHPNTNWIRYNLNGWNNAKELAGLDLNPPNREHSEEEVIDALQCVAEEIGKSPTQTEYKANKKYHHPSIPWIQDNLSSWNNAKDTAGLKVYESNDGKGKRLFIQKIKKHVQCRECGLEEPNRKLHFHHVEPDTKVDAINAMIIANYSMGELKAEIKKCEILCDTCHGHKHSKTVTKEDCINALQWVVDQLGDLPTQREYQKHKKDHHPNRKTICKRLDSWSEAKETVNLEPTQTTLQSDFASPSRNDV